MKEWQRTVILVILLVLAIGFVLYLRSGMEDSAVQILN